MIRAPPKTPRPATPVPYTTPFRSPMQASVVIQKGHDPHLMAVGHRLCQLPACLSRTVDHRLGQVHSLKNVLVQAAQPIARQRARGTYCQQQKQGLYDAHTTRHTRERSEEHTSELQSLMRLSYAVFCLKQNNIQ